MRKGDRSPEEASMMLRRRPGRPHYLAFLLLTEAGAQDAWNKYIFV
jgi:hypothetical protein